MTPPLQKKNYSAVIVSLACFGPPLSVLAAAIWAAVKALPL